MLEKKNVIQVVLAVYDPHGTYSRYAGVVMTSLFSNTQNKVNVIILHDMTLNDDNRHRFQQTAERWNQSVSFIDVSEHISRIAENPDEITHILSRGTLFRLLLPELTDIPKAIYLDCDIVVNLDIADLWNVAVDDFPLAVVRDGRIIAACHCHEKIRTWAMRYAHENYFNAGVLLMNLSQIRKRYEFARGGFNFFKRYSHVVEWADQEFLNTLLNRDVFFIEERFNRMLDCNDIGNAIVHYSGDQPWKILRDTPRDRLFWKTFAESEWRDQLGEMLAGVSKNKPLEYYRSVDCVKLLLRRVLRRLYYDKCLRLLKDFRIVLMELFCRLTRKNFAPDYEERL